MTTRALRLVFLEDQAQVAWARRFFSSSSQVTLIAVTAEALQALDEAGLPHEAVCAHADLSGLALAEGQFNRDSFSLAREIESFIAERHADVRWDGPGFLSGQGYYIQYAISAIVARALLMRETIGHYRPGTVTVFQGEIDPWFDGDGYAQNPWLELAQDFARDFACRLEVVPAPPRRQVGILSHARWLPQRACRYARRRVSELAQRIRRAGSRAAASRRGQRDGLRLLVPDSRWYDWDPVLEALWAEHGAACFRINGSRLDQREWTYYFTPRLRGVFDGSSQDLRVGLPRPEPAEMRTLSALFDEWLERRPAAPALPVLGMNVFPALRAHLRAMVSLSPAISRHADAVALRALDLVRPHAVCLFAVAWLPAKRLAFQCRQRGIPVVCYQHGANYNTLLMSARYEQIDAGHADYLLTYGTGIQPRATPAFPVRAAYVPVGSARIGVSVAKSAPALPRRLRCVRVLWVAEFSSRNTYGADCQVEDTQRHVLEKACVTMLAGAGNVRVTYRPYWHQMPWDGTTRWLERAKLRSVRIDPVQAMDVLIRRADVVITDTSSGTVWNEVLALGRPLILYCDPQRTRLAPHFASDLARACWWCQSGEALLEAVSRLARERGAFVAELRRFDPAVFVRRYVLHRGATHCVPAVVSFMNTVCHQRRPITAWEESMAGR